MKLKIISLLMFALLAQAHSAAYGQASHGPVGPPDPHTLNIVDAGYYVNSVCGSAQKCWVVHLKNNPGADGKDLSTAATPSLQLKINFDYYTGSQDAPQHGYRLTAHGTVPPLKAGADAWVRVAPDGSQRSSPAPGIQIIDAPQKSKTQSNTDPNRAARSPRTAAQLKAVAGPPIPENFRGLTASASFAKVFQKGQPFTHELTCDPVIGDSIAIIKNGQIQIKTTVVNGGYQGTCAGAKLAVSLRYLDSAGDHVFAQTSQAPETNPAAWGDAIVSFHSNCDSVCQQYCAKPLQGLEGPACRYRTDLFDGKGKKVKVFFDFPLWPPKKI